MKTMERIKGNVYGYGVIHEEFVERETDSTMQEKEFVNVTEDSSQLWELCKKEGWTHCDFEEWEEAGGVLDFFEGDPDCVKFDGEVGYFAECGNVVFYWHPSALGWNNGEVEKILRAFFAAYTTRVSPGGYACKRGATPPGVDESEKIQNWDAWERIKAGIAWRGGAGYVYDIQDWGSWKGWENNEGKEGVA